MTPDKKMTELEKNFEKETHAHIHLVKHNVFEVIKDLSERMMLHDQSKLNPPEREVFIEYTPKLAASTYGSPEYKVMLESMKGALDHHYKVNRHHPEYHEAGIRGMSLIDIMEMFCDWEAATHRHNDGCIFKSIEIQQKKLGFSDDLRQILINTVEAIRRKK